jgi:hypothetical protein
VKPFGRILGKRPLIGNEMLAYYSTGLFNGEGASYCSHRKRQRAAPLLRIDMCDRDALVPVSVWWGVSVCNGSKHACKRTKRNPEGRNNSIKAEGLRAKLLIEEMWNKGLSESKKRQWTKAVRLAGLSM